MVRPLGVVGGVEGKKGGRSSSGMCVRGGDGVAAIRGKKEGRGVVGDGIVDERMLGGVRSEIKVLVCKVMFEVREGGFIVEASEGGRFIKGEGGDDVPSCGIV